ncbi:hypothetical protein C0J52_11415 [Blattella germanica]|nr:hypothetical protein C0J52_11415 [Blattella germanica]
MVTVLSLVFTLSSLPNFLLRTLVSWSVWTFEDVFWSSFATFCLFYFHTIFNPFALFIMGSKYKAHIEQYIRIFVKEKQQVPSSQTDVRKELLIICDVMQKLGRRLAEDDLSQVSNHPDVEASRDEAAKRARLERIKRLQARFI